MGRSFVRLEQVIPCNVSCISAFKNKYGQHYYDPKINQEISAWVKHLKMSSFELIAMQKNSEKTSVSINSFIFLLVLYGLFKTLYNLDVLLHYGCWSSKINTNLLSKYRRFRSLQQLIYWLENNITNNLTIKTLEEFKFKVNEDYFKYK